MVEGRLDKQTGNLDYKALTWVRTSGARLCTRDSRRIAVMQNDMNR